MQILGLDIGGSGIKGAPVDLSTGDLLAERFRVDTPKPATPAAMARVAAQITRHFAWSGPVGCAFPARIKKGVATTASNIDKSWIGTNVSKVFGDATGCPVAAINDADAAGLAEMAFGVCRGRADVVLVLTFGTGIGSALFLGGLLLPNTELGHITLHNRIAEHYAADSARKKEGLSWQAWAQRVQDYLNRIEFLLDPDLIVLGGGISKAKKRERYFDRLKTHAELTTASLENNAGIIGAAYHAGTLVEA